MKYGRKYLEKSGGWGERRERERERERERRKGDEREKERERECTRVNDIWKKVFGKDWGGRERERERMNE